MLVDKDKALEVGNLVAQVVNDWAAANGMSRPSGNEILSALLTHAALLIARQPCQDKRGWLFDQAVSILLQGSNVPMLVATHTLADKPGDAALAAMPVAGRA